MQILSKGSNQLKEDVKDKCIHEPFKEQAHRSPDAVLITQRSLRPRLPETGTKVVYLDGDREEIDRQSISAPSALVAITKSEYVIYSSGSSGKSKSLVVEHAGMVNLVFAGELCIAGVGLARGYRNRPERTAEKLWKIDNKTVYRNSVSSNA